MKNCLPSLRLVLSPGATSDALPVATVALPPTPLQETAGLSQRRQDARRNAAEMRNRPAQQSTASRLIRGAVALGGMFGASSLARAQASTQQAESPCEALTGLRIGLTPDLHPASVGFDAQLHGSTYDQHCAVIKEIDQKYKTAGYLLIPGEFFASSKAMPQAFYNPVADHSALNADPVVTPGEIEKLKDTVRHEARHRDVGLRNVRKNLSAFSSTPYEAFDPCLVKKDVGQCQQNLLKVPDLIKLLDLGPPEGFDPALMKKIILKMQEAVRLLPSPNLVVTVDGARFAKAARLFHGQLAGGPVEKDGFTSLSLRLPDDPDEKFQDFMEHMYHNTMAAIDIYTNDAESFPKASRVHMLAAEYDATLVGFYGMKSAQAIITAAAYLPAARQNAEL